MKSDTLRGLKVRGVRGQKHHCSYLRYKKDGQLTPLTPLTLQTRSLCMKYEIFPRPECYADYEMT